ncbi:MAG: hypothetical protein K8H88_18235 [Sandaracinaceae bacterium]|nr:hypothetical protein [Sandaracinaceae bacterium]
MLSDFAKKKARHLFDTYDARHTGVLEREDYELIAHRVALEQARAPGSRDHERITHAFQTAFERMKAVADYSRDGRISPDEWEDLMEIVLSDQEAFEAIVGSTVDLLFEMFDLDHSSTLDERELARLRRVFGVPDDGGVLFRALDENGDGVLSTIEVRHAIEQFFRSEDPSQPGNLFFGPLE